MNARYQAKLSGENMKLFDEIKSARGNSRRTEERLYALAAREVDAGIMREGLWAKALAEAKMDVSIAKSKYIKLRVRTLADEAHVDAVEVANFEREQARNAAQAIALKEKQRIHDDLPSKRSVSRAESSGGLRHVFNVLLGAFFVIACDASAIRLFQWLVQS